MEFGVEDAFAAFDEEAPSRVTGAVAPDEKSMAVPAAAAASAPSDSGPGRDRDAEAYERAVEQRVVPIEISGCQAETCFPPLWDGPTEMPPLSPRKPAREYPFTLDPFQKQSVNCLEHNQSVLVSAHTSAGKTVVAEYAIAMGLRDKQRVVYTSPIKALSNQKYRELHEEFKDVGLMTGDITINPSASCLVMTTEILRNMLYRGSEVMREVAWVIFDEIHYMRDKERGVVWEETLILLPDKVRFVFLSATIPNAREFACWVAKLHNQPCNVVYTDYRPTPLQHYVFPVGGAGLYQVLDEKGVFREQNFQKAVAALGASGESASGGGGPKRKKRRRRGGRGGGKVGTDISKIVQMIMERKYDPVIVFSFSKRECEEYGTKLVNLDFTTDEEKKMINEVFNNAIDSLSDADRGLPQIHRMVPLLRRGIGIHHGGLLPILKELIEILFQEGLLKALFATETFAMGLNMPAKTVVFTGVRKFDGTDFRPLSGGEYIQMSGRAGRRGLDKRGIVIMMMDEGLKPEEAKKMIKGVSDPLNSSFHLGYNMVLNLVRVEGTDPKALMKQSFRQFQQARTVPRLRREITALRERRDAIAVEDTHAVSDLHRLRAQLERTAAQIRAEMTDPGNALPFLNPGRLLRVKGEGPDWGWGILLNYKKKQVPRPRKWGKATKAGPAEVYVLDVLLRCGADDTPAGDDDDADKGGNKSAVRAGRKRARAGKGTDRRMQPRPADGDSDSDNRVVSVALTSVSQFSAVRIYVPKNLKSKESRSAVGRSLREVLRRLDGVVPMLDPVDDMKITGKAFRKLQSRAESLEGRIKAHKLSGADDIEERLEAYEKWLSSDREVQTLEAKLSNSLEDTELQQTLKGMTRVLRRLGHVTEDTVVALKGRVACEISSCDELVVAEIILSNMLNELSAEQVVALLSCLVFRERTDDNVRLRDELKVPLRNLQECVKKVAHAIEDARLPIDVDDFVDQFKPSVMDIVFAWVKGAKFADICKLTDIYEGTIIRCVRRLEELLRQMCGAAKLIGNSDLEEKFKEGIKLLKRDIIFAASLYL